MVSKKNIIEEIISQFSEFVFWDYTKIRVYSLGPEYGVEFYSEKFKRYIHFSIEQRDSNNPSITIRRDAIINNLLLRQWGNPKVSFLVNDIFKDNPQYQKISKVLNTSNYKQIISENIQFLKENLNEIIRGNGWIN